MLTIIAFLGGFLAGGFLMYYVHASETIEEEKRRNRQLRRKISRMQRDKE